ncbi:MAG: hypothetical protein DWQ01_03915 [Planctomycetota bacterium]|nr:MAG: hypothetical protein DWQ01_03915 [Planctomycetota bacterium]
MRIHFAVGICLYLSAVPLAAQDGKIVRLPARVTLTQAGSVSIDRGTDHGLSIGDPVWFYPRGQGTVEGRVERLEARTAWVRFSDPDMVVDIGVRGEVLLPRDRLQKEQPEGQVPDHPPWPEPIQDWDPQDPLLKGRPGTHPEARPSQWGGRWTNSLNWSRSSEGGQRDFAFARSGLDLWFENPFSQGGQLWIDGELNYRSVTVPDEPDFNDTEFRLDRLSYAWGGSRQQAERIQVGRFLQYEFPEFGVLDGAEFGYRLASGDRVGASFGFMPEPNSSHSTGKDLQTAVFFRHLPLEKDHFSIGSGFQKTWHEGNQDRDLWVTTLRYQPIYGFHLYASSWVDFYGSQDKAKTSSMELTQFQATAGYRWQNGDGLNLSLRRIRFPETLRFQVSSLNRQALRDQENLSLDLSGWHQLNDWISLSGSLHQWSDQDDSGGGGEMRVEFEDLIWSGSTFAATAFRQAGKFSDATGGRLELNYFRNSSVWRLYWESVLYQQAGFSGGQADLWQQSLRLSWDHSFSSHFSLSTYLEQLFGEQQNSTSIGIFSQTTF